VAFALDVCPPVYSSSILIYVHSGRHKEGSLSGSFANLTVLIIQDDGIACKTKRTLSIAQRFAAEKRSRLTSKAPHLL
jgi:hypothetical protein